MSFPMRVLLVVAMGFSCCITVVAAAYKSSFLLGAVDAVMFFFGRRAALRLFKEGV